MYTHNPERHEHDVEFSTRLHFHTARGVSARLHRSLPCFACHALCLCAHRHMVVSQSGGSIAAQEKLYAALGTLTHVHVRVGDLAGEEASLRRTLAVARSMSPTHEKLPVILNQLAAVLVQQRKYGREAVALYEEAIAHVKTNVRVCPALSVPTRRPCFWLLALCVAVVASVKHG